MFNNCIYEFVCKLSCADHHCVKRCDHGAKVVSVTDDIL